MPTHYNTNRTTYAIKNASGEVVADHVVTYKPDGSKDVKWRQPDGTLGLNGTPVADLPLYGIHEVDGDTVLVVVTEGEKARDALTKALEGSTVRVVGTVTGASGTPSQAILEDLKGHEVVLWPDTDEPGYKHMDAIGQGLQGIASKVSVYDWPEAPQVEVQGKIKGQDAADHPAVQSHDEKAVDKLLNDLCGAPEYKPEQVATDPAPVLPGRVMLGDLLRGGIEPTPQLIEGLLYEGRIHSIAGPPGGGKTLIALWAAMQVMKKGQPVLYLDAENGPKLIAERLGELGADPDNLNEYFHYYPADDVGANKETVSRLLATIEDSGAALVVFDSFADLLSEAGLEENSNDDCTKWMRKLAQPVKDTGAAVLILDHIPKNGKGPRGGGSKRAKVDVQWNLDVTQFFDRDRTGEIELKHDKDREAWLPKIVRFSVGGGVFARSAGTIEDKDPDTRMTENASKLLDVMRRSGDEGARWKDLEDAVGGSKGTVTRGLKELGRYQLYGKWNSRYFVNEVVPGNPIDKPNTEGTTRYQNGTTVPNGTGVSGNGTSSTTPLRGGTAVPNAEPDEFDEGEIL